MSGLLSRLAKLEAHLRRDHPPGRAHDTAVVFGPREVPDEAWDDWLAEHPCACGVVACPQRRIGLVLPTPCDTVEEWAARYSQEAPHAS